MTIEQAFKAVTGLSVEEGIEKAIEGGLEVYTGELHHCNEKTLLNPLYWKSLGKAMGWKKYWCVLDREYERNDEKCDGYTEEQEAWKDYQHSFIDALAE